MLQSLNQSKSICMDKAGILTREHCMCSEFAHRRPLLIGSDLIPCSWSSQWSMPMWRSVTSMAILQKTDLRIWKGSQEEFSSEGAPSLSPRGLSTWLSRDFQWLLGSLSVYFFTRRNSGTWKLNTGEFLFFTSTLRQWGTMRNCVG